MSITLSLNLNKESRDFIKSSEDIAINTRFGIEKAFWRSGKDIQGEFNRQVLDKSSKTGRIYFRRNKAGARRKHQASAPGQTPANRSGAYRKGFDFNVHGEHELAIGDTEKHALFLEVGTSRMEKRPGIGNSIEASERDILRNLSGGIEAEL